MNKSNSIEYLQDMTLTLDKAGKEAFRLRIRECYSAIDHSK